MPADRCINTIFWATKLRNAFLISEKQHLIMASQRNAPASIIKGSANNKHTWCLSTWAEGRAKQTQKEAVILKQLFCDWSTLLLSPGLSNKVWSLFLYILQNVLMRPNPFNSCPDCQRYGYNCLCVQAGEFWAVLLRWKGKDRGFLWRRDHIKDIKRQKS